jgi:transcriptional regulator with XRE-family HTH domain
MLSPTLKEGLKAYAIGPKVRGLRLKKKVGLVELGRHTGLSPAMLSKIERGQLFPTLPTLPRIAGVQHRTRLLLHGGQGRAGRRHCPASRAAALSGKPGARDAAYEFESLDYPAVQRLPSMSWSAGRHVLRLVRAARLSQERRQDLHRRHRDDGLSSGINSGLAECGSCASRPAATITPRPTCPA